MRLWIDVEGVEGASLEDGWRLDIRMLGGELVELRELAPAPQG